jgi:hypothetical protein
MTGAQTAWQRARGGEPSHAPEHVGRKLIGNLRHRRVPRDQRPALNQGMHALYGIGWGLPLGLAARALPPRFPGRGALFGLAVWAVSLVELPALGVAPAPWRQSPGELLPDLAFHLAYGTATSAGLQALGA